MTMPSRRDVLRCAAGGVALALGREGIMSAAEQDAKLELPKLPIVDTHQHLWDLSKFKLPWLAGAKSLAKSYLPDDYRAATAGLNVVQSVYMEVDVEPEQQDAEAEYVIDLCRGRKTTMVAAVISGWPESPRFADYIHKHAKSGYIQGVRRLLNIDDAPAGLCRRAEFVEGVRLLGKLGLCFDLHPRVSEWSDAIELVEACPDTRFVVDHCGCIDPTTKDLAPWKRAMEGIAKCDRVVCKISGIVAQVREKWSAADLAPVVNYCLDTFGPDRVIFASDWPVCTLRASLGQWCAALHSIVKGRSETDQKKLWHDNAVKFYRLKRD